MFCGSGGSKSRLVKAAGAEQIWKSKCEKHSGLRASLEVEMLALWHESHFEVRMCKAHQVRSTFDSWDGQKCTPLWREAHVKAQMLKTRHARATATSKKSHAVVAWSTFRSQNGTPRSDHFGRWDVKKCRPLWRGAHLEVNMWKAHHLRTTFGRSTAPHLTTVQLQQRLITTATTTTTTTATSTTTLQLQLLPQLQLQWRLQWRLQLTLQFLKTLHCTTLYTLHFLHYIAARGLVKIPKLEAQGP